MQKHFPVYVGLGNVALGALQGSYSRAITEGINRDKAIVGTRLRGPYMPQNANEFIARMKDSHGKDEVFAILKKIGRTPHYEFAGLAGVHHATWPEGHAELGIVIYKDEHRSGTGSEAMALLIQHAFGAMHLNKVYASVKSFNAPSLGHLIKCGFTIVGRYKNHHRHGDGYTDEIHLELFKDEWKPIWEQYQKEHKLPSLTDEQRELVAKETS